MANYREVYAQKRPLKGQPINFTHERDVSFHNFSTQA
jgi:hypothetical protein